MAPKNHQNVASCSVPTSSQNNFPTMLKHEKIFFLFLGFKKQYHNDAFYTHPIL